MTVGALRIPFVIAVVALSSAVAVRGAHAAPLASYARAEVTGPRASYIVSLQPELPSYALSVAARGVQARSPEPVLTFARGAGFVASLDPATAAAVRAMPGVIGVTPNRTMEPLVAPHLDQTGVPSAWDAGLRGDGQVIAIVDTGVDRANPNLLGRVTGEACFTPTRATGGGDCPDGTTTQTGAGAAVPCTGRVDCSHGTHVASVAAGVGPEVIGVAPQAGVLAVQVFSSVRDANDRVVTDEASLVRALQWIDEERARVPIAAVNLSLGGSPVSTPCTASPALTAVIDRLIAAGIAVVASAGNDASPSSLSFPACLPHVISVGAEGTAARAASFTNVPPAISLYAPGESIRGAWSTPCCVRTLSGTSFAAPQVSATFAVLRQQLGPGSVEERLSLLRRTGTPMIDLGGASQRGAFALRVGRAVDPQYQAASPVALESPGTPFGYLDVVETEPGQLRAAGWALDADTVAPLIVHLYVDGVLRTSTLASRPRPDVGAVFRGYGAARGFDVRVSVAPGPHVVCAYGINLGPGDGNRLLGCTSIIIGDAIGALDVAVSALGALSVRGWALDTAGFDPVAVELVVDDVVVGQARADNDRPDVGAAYPAYGSRRGFAFDMRTASAAQTVCVRAIATVATRVIGCRDLAPNGGDPIGVLDAVLPTDGGVLVVGWVIDPDTADAVRVDIDIVDDDGVATTKSMVADDSRPDLLIGFPGFGSMHGFRTAVPVPAGSRSLCVFALDNESLARVLLRCVTINPA